ncbi:MAG TPA: Ig-like domain-containing protein [Edaphobacter sp.]|nr:Ig-like domain-containing protein [Edaphobacter sp.]
MRQLSIRKLTLNTLSLVASLSFAPLLASTPIPSSVVLTLTTPATIYFGQTVDGYAQVNSSDGSKLTGTITFYDNNSAICVISTAADASCPASAGESFAAGPHLVTAIYSGDADHSASTSNTASVTVLQDSTTTSVTSSPSSAIYGQNITFTATVQGAHGIPSGQVRFLDGTTVLGAGTLTSGEISTLSISTLPIGTHTITAVYGATPNSASSTSAVLNEVIQPATTTTTTTLASSANPATSGQTITFAATVVKTPQSSQPPTGTITFLDGSVLLATKVLDNTGSATFNTSTLDPGSYSLIASYAGDAMTKGSISSAMVEVVSPSQTASPASFTISAAPVVVKVGQMASIMVKVLPANGFNQQVQLGCTNLPSESSCTFGSAMIRAGGGSTALLLSTMAPHDCGASTSYYGSLPYSAPMAALILLLLPGRRRPAIKRLLMVLIAFCGLTTVTGCGNCTDLGTKPGTYTINVIGTAQGVTSMTVSKKVMLKVTY